MTARQKDRTERAMAATVVAITSMIFASPVVITLVALVVPHP